MMLVWLSLLVVYGVLQRAYVAADCGEDKFPCNDGTCIGKHLWCDGNIDCPDDSDEDYCYPRSRLFANPNRCGANFFLCLDGPCIPLVGRCDGFPSCRDHSDEADCGTTRPATSFKTEIPAVVGNSTLKAEKISTNAYSSTPTVSIDFITEIEKNEEVMHEIPRSSDATVQKWISSTKSEQPFFSTQHEVMGKPFILNEIPTNVPQADTVAKLPETHLGKKDITRGFIKVNTRDLTKSKELAQKWLLSVRDQDYGWGDETARALTALYMSDYFSNKQTEEKLLMSKQLHLKLSVALIRNKIPLSELSLYINALLASCDNPRNFYGYDLIDALRRRTDTAQEKAEFVSPLVYITLCSSSMTTLEDINKIQQVVLETGRSALNKMGIQALATLAAICISDMPRFASTQLGRNISKRLYETVGRLGLPENVYELALVVQALNEAKINQDLWNRSEAFNRINEWQNLDGSWGDILATYYILPICSGKSLVSLSDHCSAKTEMGTPVDVLMNSNDDKISVTYSLYIGKPVEVSQSLRMRVAKSAKLLDLMKIAERENPIYRFKFDMARGKPSVYSIGGLANDAEKGLYWVPHISRRNSSDAKENLTQFDGDIRSYSLVAGDHAVFWLKKLQ